MMGIGHDELYHHAKFGGDQTTRAECRCENVVFVCLFFCHDPRPARCSFHGVVYTRFCVTVYGSILMPFSAFFRMNALSDGLDSSHFVAKWRHNFQKNCD